MLASIYKKLLEEYDYQGWWPVLNNYHPRDYNTPNNINEVFEVCVGAILTQNTNWNNVMKALSNLVNAGFLSPEKIKDCNIRTLKKLITPAGYYNQKAGYLKNFTEFFIKKIGTPTREELLNIKGVGKETADSILLYAYKVPTFVVDAYTKRMLESLGVIKGSEDYDVVKDLIEKELPKDYKLFQEFHALIVEHAKHYYSKKPYGVNDFLNTGFLK
ncbi:MAG: endonuclease III domain-containing protein [Nanoarchaeota archaeon]|nr:endonuclease III domain-containing protein [Nanoarchaeota archaeon]